MSWIIQSLLNNKNIIKARNDIEGEEYSDLLVVENAIKKLMSKNLITDNDIDVISIMSGDKEGFANITQNQKRTLYKRYASVCERIAYFLGGYFTDEGYLDYIRLKYGMSNAQVEHLRHFIKSTHKHNIVQRGFDEPEEEVKITENE